MRWRSSPDPQKMTPFSAEPRQQRLCLFVGLAVEDAARLCLVGVYPNQTDGAPIGSASTRTSIGAGDSTITSNTSSWLHDWGLGCCVGHAGEARSPSACSCHPGLGYGPQVGRVKRVGVRAARGSRSRVRSAISVRHPSLLSGRPPCPRGRAPRRQSLGCRRCDDSTPRSDCIGMFIEILAINHKKRDHIDHSEHGHSLNAPP